MRTKTSQQRNESLPGRISLYLRSHQDILLIGAGIIYLLLSFLTFNLRISEGGDDSAYIIRALRLIEEGRFPKFQGPVYPTVLSLLVGLTGLNIVALKISSWLFLTFSLLLLLKSYSKEVSLITITATGFLLIVNHHFLYFGSQTYSEAFFMCLQAGFLFFLFHTIEWQKQHRIKITQAAVLAFLLVTLYLTRTVALVATPALIIYFITRKQWRGLFFTTLFVTIFLSAYFLMLNTFTNIEPTGNDQLTSLLQKHPYEKSQGMETLSGFFIRFWENSKIYLSKHFFILTGFKPAMSLSKPALPAIILYLLFIWGVIRFYKAGRHFLFFTGIYVAFTVGLTFFALQPLWDQVRLIIPFFPLILILIIENIISLVRQNNQKWIQKISLLVIGISIILTGVQTIKQTDFSSVFKNIKGEKLYGYTPDWQNYLKMSKYVARELPEESYVACRKPNMARLYSGGKKFYGIYSFNSDNPDTLLMSLYERKVSHIMVASLRKNPRSNTGQVINTIHRYMSFIAKKYPNSFILRKQIGEEEKAWLFEIDYTRFLENNPELKHSAETK